jgi:hypothetical protein
MMDYFAELTTWTPDQVVQHVAEVKNDPQLVRYFRRIIVATMNHERVGDVLSAQVLEDMWRNMFSRDEQRLIWK